MARAAIDRIESSPESFPAEVVTGVVLSDACRWYEFRIDRFDDSQERTDFHAVVVHVGRLRDVFGFNRAKHAVLEAAILATRVHLLPANEIRRQFDELAVPVEKTAGPRERVAFELLREFVGSAILERD